jgi:curved DNA-binding protein CbpA
LIEIPLAGSIKDFSLPKVLAYFNRNRKTGTLIIKTPVFTKKVYLVKGDAIFASSTYEDDRLGEMLIKAGKITLEQYDASVELLKKTGKRQGAILVELGYLTPKELFWGVKYQVKEIIYSLFQFEDAEYEFVEGEIPTQEVITLKMSMGNLVYEGVKRIDSWTRIKNEMPDADSILKLSTDPIALFQDIELSQQDRKMLSIIDGKKTIKEIINSSWIGSFEAMKILYVLWSIGVLEEKEKAKEKVTEKEKAEEVENLVSPEEILQPIPEDEEDFRRRVDEIYLNLDSLSPNELLEVDDDSDEETIKRNYYRLAREFHPDRYFSSADPSIKDKLTSIFDAIARAFDMLKDDKKTVGHVDVLSKEKKEEVSDAQKAEEQFKRGVEEFKNGNFWGAVDSLKWSVKLEPKKAKYWSYLSLSYIKIPNRLKDAEETLLEAIKLDPYNSEYYVNLGMIYIKAGMKKRAYNQFEKALKFDPVNIKAKKGLEQTKG